MVGRSYSLLDFGRAVALEGVQGGVLVRGRKEEGEKRWIVVERTGVWEGCDGI